MRFEIEAKVRRTSGFSLEAAFSCDADSIGLFGPSGSGKSTLLDAIAGVEAGARVVLARVVLDGADVSRVPLQRRNLGYVTQDALLFPHLTVRGNLGYSPRAGSIEEVARWLEIDHLLDRMPRHLSGGERRRVALARTLLSRPRLLLLDEPFAGLDASRRREAMALISLVRQTLRVPAILVSHREEDLLSLTDWTLRLEEGRIAASGPSQAVLGAH